MAVRRRCVGCNHEWQPRESTVGPPQCPRCKRYRTVNAEAFDDAVRKLVQLLRPPGGDLLGRFSEALDLARAIVLETIPDPFLASQTAFEVVREALDRLGFRPPPRPPFL